MEKRDWERTVTSKERAEQEELIDAMRTRKEKYTTQVAGKDFAVHPGVLSPAYCLDSGFFYEQLPDQKDKDVLEVGSGVGLISIRAAEQGARTVTAVDINPVAVENTNENARLHGLASRVTAYVSDIYDAIPAGQKFNTIVWNVPWGDFGEGEQLDSLQQAFYDPGYKLLKRFIDEASKFLKPGGKLLIGFSTTIGNGDILKKILANAGFTYRIAAQKTFEFGHPSGPVSIEYFEAVLA